MTLQTTPNSTQTEAAVSWLKPGTQQAMYNMAQSLAKAALVPASFKGKADDIYFVLMMAMELEIQPITALNSMYVVGGRPAMYTSLAIALANQRGPFSTPINWKSEGEGDNLKVMAHAKLKGSGDIAKAVVSMEMAKAEGWTKNKKYSTMPEHMLKYRAAIFLIRTTCPEVLNGLHTKEEIEDIELSESVDVTPSKDATTIKELNAPNKERDLNTLMEEVNQQVIRLYKDGKTENELQEYLGMKLADIKDLPLDQIEEIVGILAEVG